MKKIKILIFVLTVLLSFPIHFLYSIYPGFFTSIFFPVNESIWEHMKIIYTSILISSIIEYIIYKKKNIKVNNTYINIPIISIIGIAIYLLIYIPIDILFSHNLFIAIILLIFTFSIIEIISYKILNRKEIKYEKLIGIILIVISYIIFIYLTYYPPKTMIFMDSRTKTYGINK